MEGPVAFSIMFFGERRNDFELVLGNLFYWRNIIYCWGGLCN
jgi:hypothetical protein